MQAGTAMIEPPPTSIRVLIVDDHPLMREGIAMVLGEHACFQIVGEAGNGQEALEQYIRLRPDIALIDLQMPVMDGVEATAAIRALVPAARIIILTTYKGDVQVANAIRAGASGYLLKSMLRTELVEAIHKVHQGRIQIALDAARELAMYSASDTLSPREMEVIALVARGNSNKAAGALLGVTEETVKAHMSSIMSKLGANDRTHAVMIALRRGIVRA
jgi:DNA-binding NarL/FixJ family response regulator